MLADWRTECDDRCRYPIALLAYSHSFVFSGCLDFPSGQDPYRRQQDLQVHSPRDVLDRQDTGPNAHEKTTFRLMIYQDLRKGDDILAS
jgi:hypothetical protein